MLQLHRINCYSRSTRFTFNHNGTLLPALKHFQQRSAHRQLPSSRPRNSSSKPLPQQHYTTHIAAGGAAAAAVSVMGDTHDASLPGLLATCVLMFLGAYGCGMLPSWLPISEQRLASVSMLLEQQHVQTFPTCYSTCPAIYAGCCGGATMVVSNLPGRMHTAAAQHAVTWPHLRGHRSTTLVAFKRNITGQRTRRRTAAGKCTCNYLA
jgi:hypothetical protein